MNNYHQQPVRTQATFTEKMATAELIAMVPAMTLMLNSRKDIGARLARRQIAISGILLLLGVGYFVELQQPNRSPVLILIGFVTLFQYGFHLLRRWREFRRGASEHSYYLGTSGFEFRWMPKFIRRSRVMSRFVDPLVFGAAGFLVIKYLFFFGMWLIVSSACLLFVELRAWSREVHRELDVSDGLVTSEVQSDTVDRFSPPPDRIIEAAHASDVIPTGLGSDIADKIRRRKRA